MATGYLSKGMKLSYSANIQTPSFTALTDLQEVPEMGGDTEAVDITTLDDAAFMYRNGIKNYGNSLNFKFLYDPIQFTALQALTTEQLWKLEIPDGVADALDTAASWTGTCSVKLDSVGVNAPLTYTLSIRPQSEITFA